MTFEEDFPTAKNFIVEDTCWQCENPVTGQRVIAIEHLNKCCRDNQRIRDVIEKLKKQDWSLHKEHNGLVRAVLFDLEEELKL